MSHKALSSRTATGVVIEQDEHILLIMKGRGPYKERLWCIPGGKLEPDETPEDCAVREVREETGLNIKIIRKVCTDEDTPLVNGEPVHYYFHNYHAQLHGGKLQPSDDCKIARWFNKNEMKDLPLSPPTWRTLKQMGLI